MNYQTCSCGKSNNLISVSNWFLNNPHKKCKYIIDNYNNYFSIYFRVSNSECISYYSEGKYFYKLHYSDNYGFDIINKIDINIEKNEKDYVINLALNYIENLIFE